MTVKAAHTANILPLKRSFVLSRINLTYLESKNSNTNETERTANV